ncbi:hypothetical protein H6F78_17025 [Coleofasciculus sp. FACHB-64]|uniref:hypothetical protein n=1 Tax=Cyanophyceae TaxID=3028117 RepID=UPI0016898371|nr:hypothetical protein [Coleofasciculus sp. FACHB-64]MBD2047274.1 hypothetical protein [Coleofasciculus sp. FACHB-64]
MGSTTSKRVSVKAYLLPYLDEIAKEIGTNDYSEIVHQLLLEHKRFIRKGLSNFSNDGLIQMPTQSQVRALEKSKPNISDDDLSSALSDLFVA